MKLIGVAAVGMVVAFFFAINIFPIITNDSLEYLDHSRAPGDYGAVSKGYRQIGYPLILLMSRSVSGLVGVEPLLLSALLQRLLLLGALGYAIWLWRWKATPIVLLVVAPSFLVYPNFILTEGVTVPLGLLLACLVSHHFRLAGDSVDQSRKGPLVLAALTAAVAFVMVAIRYPLAVFGAVPVAILGAAFSRGNRVRGYGAVLAVFLALSGLLSVLLAVENHREFGVLSPTTNGSAAEYWGAWHVTFALRPENRIDPQLAEFWDNGRPHRRIALVQERRPEYPAQAIGHREDIETMLRLAGLDHGKERAFSFFGALRGGRTDDLISYMGEAINADARSVDAAIFRSLFAMQNGREAFAERYNDGVLPQAAILPAILPTSRMPYLRLLLSYLLPAALIGTVVLSIHKRRIWMGVAYLVPVMVLAAAMGWLLLDNVRFLMPGSVYAVAGFSALWSTGHRVHQPGSALPHAGSETIGGT